MYHWILSSFTHLVWQTNSKTFGPKHIGHPNLIIQNKCFGSKILNILNIFNIKILTNRQTPSQTPKYRAPKSNNPEKIKFRIKLGWTNFGPKILKVWQTTANLDLNIIPSPNISLSRQNHIRLRGLGSKILAETPRPWDSFRPPKFLNPQRVKMGWRNFGSKIFKV